MLFDAEKSRCKTDALTVVSSENNNRHILENISRVKVYQYHIDGDIITGTADKKCDYIVEAMTTPRPVAFVIELKGSDIIQAIRQIESTILKYKNKLEIYEICPRIVVHKVTTLSLRSSEYRKLKKLYPDFDIKSKEKTDRV